MQNIYNITLLKNYSKRLGVSIVGFEKDKSICPQFGTLNLINAVEIQKESLNVLYFFMEKSNF